MSRALEVRPLFLALDVIQTEQALRLADQTKRTRKVDSKWDHDCVCVMAPIFITKLARRGPSLSITNILIFPRLC